MLVQKELSTIQMFPSSQKEVSSLIRMLPPTFIILSSSQRKDSTTKLQKYSSPSSQYRSFTILMHHYSIHFQQSKLQIKPKMKQSTTKIKPIQLMAVNAIPSFMSSMISLTLLESIILSQFDISSAIKHWRSIQFRHTKQFLFLKCSSVVIRDM